MEDDVCVVCAVFSFEEYSHQGKMRRRPELLEADNATFTKSRRLLREWSMEKRKETCNTLVSLCVLYT